ncbi:MAG: D-alanine--D-alanine ligase [Patescibacteria group bacterium]
MKIALTFNQRSIHPYWGNGEAEKVIEFDLPETIFGIKSALEKDGHKVRLVEANKEAYLKLKKLKKEIDLVFNVAEGMHGEDREAQIPAMLEMLQIPYTGSGPLALALTLDKSRAKEILKLHKIPTANFFSVAQDEDLPAVTLDFPLIVKPNSEGSSKGIKNSAVVKSILELKEKIKEIHKKYHQKALVEEFLPGREFTVGILGNNPPQVLPIVEVDFSNVPSGFHKIDSYETKWLFEDKLECPAKICHSLRQKIEEISLKTFLVLGCRDLARIDIRLDKNGCPHILEVNALPGLIPDPKQHSRFPAAAFACGYAYEKLINKIVAAACQRYGLKLREEKKMVQRPVFVAKDKILQTVKLKTQTAK